MMNSSQFLKDLYLEKRARNSRYSLRSFARQLGVSPALLSPILNGRASVSPAVAKKCLEKITMADLEKKLFMISVSFENEKNPAHKKFLIQESKRLITAYKRSKTEITTFNDPSYRWKRTLISEVLRPFREQGLTFREIAKRTGFEVRDLVTTLAYMTGEAWIQRLPNQKYCTIVTSPIDEMGLSNNCNESYSTLIQTIQQQLPTEAADERAIGYEFVSIRKENLKLARELTYQYLDSIAALAEQVPTEDATSLIAIRTLAVVQKVKLSKKRISK